MWDAVSIGAKNGDMIPVTKKGRGEEKKRWEKRGFSPSLLKRFSSPLPFFGKEKYDWSLVPQN